MKKAISVLAFLFFLGVSLLFSYWITGELFPTAETKNLWFYSGIMMVLFSMFFVEPYYTAPTNVIANSFAILLLLISVQKEMLLWPTLHAGWVVLFVYTSAMLLLALIATLLHNKEKSAESMQNRAALGLKDVSMRFGSGKVLFSSNFLFFILAYQNMQRPEVLWLMVFWWIIVVSEPQKLIDQLSFSSHDSSVELGEIFGVQSRQMFLAKLYKDKSNVNKFDLVEFCYSMQEGKVHTGLVFDSYLLNQEKWVKILSLDASSRKAELKHNVVYKCKEQPSLAPDLLERFVGIVVENSDIGLIKFEFSSISPSLQEGDLLEIDSGGHSVYYQLINGVTDKRQLEAKNETGFIRGEAIQLGVWNDEGLKFEKFGWVPEINSIVLKARTEFEEQAFAYPDYEIGKFPATNLPAVINLHDAVTHHLAILGITGSGKSFIAREIIRQLLIDMKVICVDFTGEYAKELADLKPELIIKNKEGLNVIEETLAKKADTKNHAEILKFKKEIQDKLTGYVDEFAKLQDKNLGLFELPDLSNTTFILEFTQLFLESIFKYVKEREGLRVCIVVEEAQTIIPETSSLGDLGDYGSNKALVNKIGQIALQGRKYGVGFIVIAQRTANVSKTVLTQCNTIISFQAFDQTSFGFLENYIGKNLIGVLPNLKQYHAILCGKGFRSNIPMIVDLTRTKENGTPS
jgi:uncharacterized protein